MHFTVMVEAPTEKELEKKLAPFQENNMGDCPEEYLVFDDCTDEVLQAFNEEVDLVEIEGILYTATDYRFVPKRPVVIGEGMPNSAPKYQYPEGAKFSKGIRGSAFEDLKDFAQRWFGYTQRGDRYGYVHNPNSHWDWWQIGGRWTGKLPVKENAMAKAISGSPGLFGSRNTDPRRADSLLKGDIDFETMIENATRQSADQWDQFHLLDLEDTHAYNNWVFDNVGVYDSEKVDDLKSLDREAFIDKYGRRMKAMTYAFLNGDEWINEYSYKDTDEDYNEVFWAWFDSLSDDARVWVVDCHV